MTSPAILPSELITNENNQLLTTSIKVAEAFGKQHRNVTAKIKSLDCSDKFRCANFSAHPYVNRQNGETYTLWNMTKDGFMFLVMGFTGKKAAAIKEAYINAFNKMAEKLYNIQSAPIMPQLPKHTPHEYFDTDISFSNYDHKAFLSVDEPCIELGATVATCSLSVASIFNKPHAEVVEMIKTLDCSTGFKYTNFSAEWVGDVHTGEVVYYITKDGLTFLMMNLKLGANVKEAYIREFNAKKRSQLYKQSTNLIEKTAHLNPLGRLAHQHSKR